MPSTTLYDPILCYDNVLADANASLSISFSGGSPNVVAGTAVEDLADGLLDTCLGIENTTSLSSFTIKVDCGTKEVTGGDHTRRCDAFAMTGQTMVHGGARPTVGNQNDVEVTFGWSDDDIAWTDFADLRISYESTIVECWASSAFAGDAQSDHRYWRANFLALGTGFPDPFWIGTMFLGRALVFPEPLDVGHDEMALDVDWSPRVSRGGGAYQGLIHRATQQTVTIRPGPAGWAWSWVDFDTGITPSWHDFVTTCYVAGDPFWFAARADDSVLQTGGLYVDPGNPKWYAFPDRRGRLSTAVHMPGGVVAGRVQPRLTFQVLPEHPKSGAWPGDPTLQTSTR